MRDYKLTLNLVTNEAPGSKIFKQYDTGNEIELELYQNEHLNADEKLVLTDESVLAFFKRQDGQVLQKNCTVRNGNVIVTTSKDVLGVPGVLELECLVKKGDVETTTTRMIFTVQESIARDGAIEEDPRYTSDLVTELLDVRDNVKAETIGKIEEVASDLEETKNEVNLKANKEELNKINEYYSKLIYPEEFSISEEMKINIYKFGAEYNTDFDIKTKKISNGGKKYYISPTGLDTNDGTSKWNPLKTIEKALEKTDIETLVFLKGNYYSDTNYNLSLLLEKDINFIADGEVNLISGYLFMWEKHESYDNIWKVNLNGKAVTSVISLIEKDEYGNNLEFIKKTSLTNEVVKIPFSYAIGTTLYINLPNGLTPNKDTVAVLNRQYTPIKITSDKFYSEGINYIGGDGAVVTETPVSKDYDCEFAFNNCKFSYSFATNGFNGFGGKYFMYKCRADNNFMDGLNYHSKNNDSSYPVHKPHVIEIDSSGYCNGKQENGIQNNGSTAHDFANVIRLNGDYGENQGSNVADASKTKSININCKAHDTRNITQDNRMGNFVAIAESDMWIIDCLSYGSKYDLIADSSRIYKKNVQENGLELTVGTGSISNIAL